MSNSSGKSTSQKEGKKSKSPSFTLRSSYPPPSSNPSSSKSSPLNQSSPSSYPHYSNPSPDPPPSSKLPFSSQPSSLSSLDSSASLTLSRNFQDYANQILKSPLSKTSSFPAFSTSNSIISRSNYPPSQERSSHNPFFKSHSNDSIYDSQPSFEFQSSSNRLARTPPPPFSKLQKEYRNLSIYTNNSRSQSQHFAAPNPRFSSIISEPNTPTPLQSSSFSGSSPVITSSSSSILSIINSPDEKEEEPEQEEELEEEEEDEASEEEQQTTEVPESDNQYSDNQTLLGKRKRSNFQCEWENCNLSFSTRTGLATHCGSHLSVYLRKGKKRKDITCAWKKCTEHFPDLKALAKHLAQDGHIGQTPFLPKQEETKSTAKQEKKWICGVSGCEKRFTDPSNCKKHEKTHDINRERFHCQEPGCKKSYSTKTDLNIHTKVHRGDYPHKCTHPNCTKAFVRLSELYAHERTHDNILPHECYICGKKFREKSRLLKHKSSHSLSSHT